MTAELPITVVADEQQVSREAVNLMAREVLKLTQPIFVCVQRMPEGIRGEHLYVDAEGGYHVIRLSDKLGDEQRSCTLVHELTHAWQAERYGVGALKQADREYAYADNPFEQHARKAAWLGTVLRLDRNGWKEQVTA